MDEKQKLCLKCLKCCKILLVPITKEMPYGLHRFFSPKAQEFWGTRRCRMYIDAKADRPWLVVNFPCPHLTDKGCGIYDTRPLACRDYDGRKDPYLAKVCLWNELEEDV